MIRRAALCFWSASVRWTCGPHCRVIRLGCPTRHCAGLLKGSPAALSCGCGPCKLSIALILRHLPHARCVICDGAVHLPARDRAGGLLAHLRAHWHEVSWALG